MLRIILASGLATALLSSTALAADLPTRKEAPAFTPPPAAVTWTGFYIGVNGGYGGDEFKYPFSLADPGIPLTVDGSASLNSSGFLGGAQVGYNYQFASSWVGGLEADIDAASITGKVKLNASATGGPGPTTIGLGASAGSQQDYLGTVRARLGYLVTPQFLLFATGGLAYGDVKSSVNAGYSVSGGGPTGTFAASKTTTQAGWTAGAGVEYALNKNWSFKTEYLYVDLGSANLLNGSVGGLTYNLKVHTTDNIVRAGLNYTFN